jgi:hypothetical protein
VDRRTPRRRAHRTAGGRGGRQAAVADLDGDVGGIGAERFGGDLRQDRARPGADVRGRDLDGESPVGVGDRARPRRLLIGGVDRGGDAHPAQQAVAAARCVQRLTAGPAEALGAGAQAGDEVARAEAVPGLGIDVGVVAHAQLDRIHVAGERQLVDRRLQREHPRALARRPHPVRRRHVERQEPVGREPVAGRVHRARDDRGLLRELAQPRGLLDRLVGDGGEPAVGIGAEAHALDRRRAVAGDGEHLPAAHDEADRPAHDLRRHRRDHGVRAHRALGAEAAADVLGHHAHALLVEAEDLGERRPGGGRALA